MLHELHIEYKDGRTEHKIIHTNPGEQVILYPQQDGIKFANHKSFKYRVKQPKMCIAIVNLGDNMYIYPDKIICHPKTTIDDIEVIQTRVNKPREEKPKTWVFESSSGGGIYEVRITPNGLKCNCFGAIRSKQNCKHIKQVRTEIQ
jgi:hypothetical protein